MDQAIDNRARLITTVEKVLASAKRQGASAAEVDIGTGQGLSVTVRNGEVETIEHQRDKGMGITVYFGGRKGSANTTDFSDQALDAAVQAACTIARNMGEDPCAGLIDPRYIAREVPDLDLCHPWDITPEQAIAITTECEAVALQTDKRIVNADGTSLHTYQGIHIYGNTHDFIDGWAWSNHSLQCVMIAAQDGNMQRDGWYTRARDREGLQDRLELGRYAAQRALDRLGARKLPTTSVPVIFEAPAARGLLSTFISAISGGALYRNSSFLLDSIGKKIFSDHITISEQPHIAGGPGSAPFDNDGMATRDRELVTAGVLNGYLLSAYSARKLGMQPTGNAGGVHNLIISHGDSSLQELIREMHKGLLITDTIGFGVNNVTGDYSKGVSGFWIENGEIKFPVEEITVAGNLKDMYRQVIQVGNDIDRRGNIQTGSILIENMMIAGD